VSERPIRRSILGASLLTSALAGCGPATPMVTPHTVPPEAVAKYSMAETILNELCEKSPDFARGLGLHERDGQIADYSRQGIAARIAWLHEARKRLDAEPSPTPGSFDASLDKSLMRLEIDQELFHIEELDEWEKRPSYYGELFTVDGYLNRDYAPLEARVGKMVEHLEKAKAQVPNVLANLKGPMSRPVVETAVKIYRGYAEYLEGDALTLVAPLRDRSLAARAEGLCHELARAAKEIADHLEKDELPRSDASHVLGAERFAKLLRVQEALDMPVDELLRMGEEDLALNKAAYERLAATVKETRPPAKELLSDATKLTKGALAFIVDQKLVSIPEPDRIEVRETPPFMRYNSAFLDGPGPFDKPGLPAFYYVTPPDPKWSPKEQEDYVMPFGTLLSTSVHEVYPGHYLQGMWIRRAPTFVQKAISSYSFVEGWAHYGEQLMIERGFGKDDPQNRLGQLADALLRDCRVVVSIGIHTRGMTLEAAQQRFERDCKQDPATAREQAVRGTFDPGYFAYTLGKMQIVSLRKEAAEQLGGSFDLRDFHDALLAHGSPPVPMIRARVLADLAAKAAAH
jgi:hypothetical protein